MLPAAGATAVALTVDDGPDPHWTPQVLALFARLRVQATFSLIGRQARAHPDLARRVVEEGHSICNHTMTHPLTFARRTPTEVRRQVVDAQSAIIDATSEAPRLFRAPAGVWSPTVLRTAAGNGMVPIDWNVDPRDWSRPGTAHKVRQMLAMRPGDIVLCHDGGGNRQETVQALGTVLPILLTVASPSSRSEGRQVPNGPGTASGTPRGAGGEEEHTPCGTFGPGRGGRSRRTLGGRGEQA